MEARRLSVDYALAASLSMSTIAEGIETERQLAELRSLGCTNGQGYYFSPPVDAADAYRLILDRSCAVMKD